MTGFPPSGSIRDMNDKKQLSPQTSQAYHLLTVYFIPRVVNGTVS